MTTQVHSPKPAIRFWVSPRLSGNKVHNGMLPILTGTRSSFIVAGAWAKSQARIDTRQHKRRNSRHQSGFFYCCGCPASSVYDGLERLLSGRPVSFCAGSINLSSLSPIKLDTLGDRFQLQKESVL